MDTCTHTFLNKIQDWLTGWLHSDEASKHKCMQSPKYVKHCLLYRRCELIQKTVSHKQHTLIEENYMCRMLRETSAWHGAPTVIGR